jgi:hypothetical protein
MLALLHELSRDPGKRRRQVAGVVIAVVALAVAGHPAILQHQRGGCRAFLRSTPELY